MVRGPYRNLSGYGRHTRAFLAELVAMGRDVALEDLPGWSSAEIYPAREDLRQQDDARAALHFCMPHQLDTGAVRAAMHVNYTMFEASRVPALWAARASEVAKVIVPTASSRAAWIAAGVPNEKLAVVPLGIDPAFRPDATPLKLRDPDGRAVEGYRHRFLHVAEVGPRKNLPGLFRVWLRATAGDDDAILVVKLVTHSPDRLLRVLRDLDAAERETGRRRGDAAPILLTNEVLADEDMPRLHAAATVYVSMSFGEGWDQPMMEAAASDRTLIAPSSSAYLDNLDESVATLLPVTAVPAEPAGDPLLAELFAGAMWWRPDEEVAIDAVRAVIAGTAPARGSPRAKVLRWTWRAAAERLMAAIREIA